MKLWNIIYFIAFFLKLLYLASVNLCLVHKGISFDRESLQKLCEILQIQITHSGSRLDVKSNDTIGNYDKIKYFDWTKL